MKRLILLAPVASLALTTLAVADERQAHPAERTVAPAYESDAPQPATAAPGIGGAEIRRLASTIVDAAGEIAAPERPAAQGHAPAALSTPVRIVSLTLNPEHLGRVSVTIRLAGDRLSLRMEAEKDETARMIASDSNALIQLLDGDGYGVDYLTMATAGDLMPPGSGIGGGVSVSGADPDPGSGSQRQSSQHARDEGRTPSRARQSPDSETSSREEAPPPGRPGRIYV